jgi:NAD(P)-dependent dehydrogenase (short-subunit alcohol dehydrogenase family)
MPTHRFDLSGKTALVTGAAGLLGIQHSAALLECDATVVMTDLLAKQLLEAKRKLNNEFPTANILLYEMDVSSPEAIHSVQKALSDEGVKIDILINNAAIDPKVNDDAGMVETSRLENFPREQWDLRELFCVAKPLDLRWLKAERVESF